MERRPAARAEDDVSLRERKRTQTVAAIRGAAARLFRERGYEATRTRDIAEEAGIAAGTLFNYARTKEDVVRLLWKERAGAAVSAGLAAAGAVSDPVDAVCALFAPIFAMYAEDPALGRIFLSAVVYASDADEEMRGLSDGFVARIALLLAPVAGVGAIVAATNVFAAYFLVVTMMLGGRVPTEADARRMFRELVRAQARSW